MLRHWDGTGCYIIGVVLDATSLGWYWYLLCICMSDCIHVTLCADRLSPAPVVSLHQKKTVFISCGAEHTAVLTKVKVFHCVCVCWMYVYICVCWMYMYICVCTPDILNRKILSCVSLCRVV